MDADRNLPQPDMPASDAGVMLFDGWEFTPVRFPPAKAANSAAPAEPRPQAPIPAD